MNYFGYPIVNGFRSFVPSGLYDPKKGHTGVDISMPIGTALALPTATRVRGIHVQNEMGLTLYLEDGDGRILVFAHLFATEVTEGALVKANQVFAKSGNSGSATTGPHLHFEVISKTADKGLEFMTRTLQSFSGYNSDPIPYLNALFAEHWSQEAMDWAREHQIIQGDHDLDAPMTWGEAAVTMKRLAEKILEWKGN